ncbi:MAG TPA: diaminopimelate epimerase [Candidatus Binatia bacterium]|jgi:diaminopimelate epimerase|nr:diaminopimelate epimerase [Candidatus Binatia bacterium]
MATLPFVKLHGTANDFVYVDARGGLPGDTADLARRLCDRHRGIGADGLILLHDTAVPGADVRMEIVNTDGSTAEMCGNGIRGFAKFVLDRGLSTAAPLRVETGAGVLTIDVERQGGRVVRVAVDMGRPEWNGRRIPVDADGEIVERPLEVAGREYRVTCVAMGNPHCVVFLDDIAGLDLPALGPRFEHHPFFPKRVNTEFIRVVSRTHLEMRVWERGAAETQACGTGACAAAVAAARTGRTERAVRVSLPGGDLEIEWLPDDHVRMTGDAVEVFEGRIEV